MANDPQNPSNPNSKAPEGEDALSNPLGKADADSMLGGLNSEAGASADSHELPTGVDDESDPIYPDGKEKISDIGAKASPPLRPSPVQSKVTTSGPTISAHASMAVPKTESQTKTPEQPASKPAEPQRVDINLRISGVNNDNRNETKSESKAEGGKGGGAEVGAPTAVAKAGGGNTLAWVMAGLAALLLIAVSIMGTLLYTKQCPAGEPKGDAVSTTNPAPDTKSTQHGRLVNVVKGENRSHTGSYESWGENDPDGVIDFAKKARDHVYTYDMSTPLEGGRIGQ